MIAPDAGSTFRFETLSTIHTPVCTWRTWPEGLHDEFANVTTTEEILAGRARSID
ncbi:MAG TPA: hypothetical protein VLB29_01155 [Nocardioidaceae bacterium]|nr:hypothetical protein [Nocardioidaceae bacterium]